jgi:CheY-like chemotaxis protein
MPVMDGWEFLEALNGQAWQPHLRVCVLTSSIQPNGQEKASAYPEVKAYFSKPVSVNLLNELVPEYIPNALPVYKLFRL